MEDEQQPEVKRKNKKWKSVIPERKKQNILAIPARFVSVDMAKLMVDTFLSTQFEGGRHEKRVNKINKIKLEKSNS